MIAPLKMSIASVRLSINQEIPPSMTPFSSSTIAHKTQGKLHLHLPVYSIIKDVIKDGDEQPDEEVHKARSKRVPRAGTPGPVDLGCITLLARGCVHQPESSRKPAREELLWKLHHIVLTNY